jgi:ABC-type sugar transport system substrate-binding protein
MKSKSLWRPVGIAFVVAVGALGLSACGGGDSSSSSSTTVEEEAPSGGEETTAAETSAGDSLVAESEKIVEEAEQVPTEISSAKFGPFEPEPNKTIFFASCEQAIEGCSNMVAGAKEAVKVLGYKLETCAATGTDPESGPHCLDQALAAKPDAILYLGLEQVAEPWFPKAQEAGIPVVGMFSGNAKGSADVQVAGGTLSGEQAEKIAAFLISSTGGKAHALVTWAAGYDAVIERKDVIDKVLSGCAECSTTDLEFDPTKVQEGFSQQVTSALQGDPELNFVVGTFDVPATFAIPAVRELGRPEVGVTGFDGTAPNITSLREEGDIYKADDGNGTREPGWTAVDVAARLIAGEKVPFNVPVQTMLMTPNNIGELPDGFRGAENFEQQYEELWGKG